MIELLIVCAVAFVGLLLLPLLLLKLLFAGIVMIVVLPFKLLGALAHGLAALGKVALLGLGGLAVLAGVAVLLPLFLIALPLLPVALFGGAIWLLFKIF